MQNDDVLYIIFNAVYIEDRKNLIFFFPLEFTSEKSIKDLFFIFILYLFITLNFILSLLRL